MWPPKFLWQRESWRRYTDLIASNRKWHMSFSLRDHRPKIISWPQTNCKGSREILGRLWIFDEHWESRHTLTLLPSYFCPCRTEPQSSLMVPAQDGPSEKLSQHLATEALGTNSWERDKACRELSPARARRWDLAPLPSSEQWASSSWRRNDVCFSGHSLPLCFASSSFGPLNQESANCFFCR